jgi:hypothetical protein
MATIFKSISPEAYTITPFPAYYKYTYTYISGSTSNSPDIQVFYGQKFSTSSGLRVENITYDIFDSVMQNFYSAIPYTAYGTKTTSYIPSQSVYVISITQDLFGEKIVPGTFNIKVGTSQSYDDAKGNIIVSSSGTGSIVGRIFYDKGVALLKPTSSIAGGGLTNGGLYIASGSSMQTQFTSSVKMYENMFKVKLDPTDFLYTLSNPTVTSELSASTKTPLELQVSGSLLPYVTTIGFYNEKNELLLVAKPSVPIQRTSDSVQTFIVKFDT